MNDYYQPPPRRNRQREQEVPRETRVDLPHFHGKENVEIYLDWEMKVEQLFACHRVSEERKVPLAALSFQGNAMYWWTSLERERRLHREPPITYWNDLRRSCTFTPIASAPLHMIPRRAPWICHHLRWTKNSLSVYHLSLYLFLSLIIGLHFCLDLDLHHLISAHLVPTPEERSARRQRRFVPEVSKNTKAVSVLGAHARGETCREQCRIVPRVLNTKMTRDFGDYAQGEGFPKEGASPTWRVSA